VDLNGYSRPSRLAVFAQRPAPILVSWFNMFAPPGMGCFNLIIGDRHVIPSGAEAHFGAPIGRVAGSYLTFEVDYPVPEVSPAPCLSRGSFTFGCLAPQYKITPEVVEAWARILHGSPGSRLILKNTVLASPENRAFVQRLFARFGIAEDRVELDGPAEHYTFLEKYAEIDLALDTFPYNGGTTTMEALWQGVPVLTFDGDRWASQISASLLRNAGLAGFVAPDLEGYVRNAITLANDSVLPGQLDTLRRNLRDHLRRAPVCDARSFAAEMEGHYLRLWEHH
jgi:predicted O-linked N-acetylglucosamine transferase (SPINDLY family)